MKTIVFGGCLVVITAGFYACTNAKAERYVDLLSTKPVELVKDEPSGLMIDRATNRPVILYVDTRTNDTIYNPTGETINGHISQVKDHVYLYDTGERKIKIDGDEYKYKSDNVKIKSEGDEYKYEDDFVTIKMEGGEYKIERKGYLKKVDDDDDVKIKTKDKKIKIDGETGEKKVKNRSIFSKVKDKITGE